MVFKEEHVVEAGRLLARNHPVSSVARAIGDHVATGTAAIAATGARLTRHLTGRPAAAMPEHVRLAVHRALAAEARQAAAGSRAAAVRSAGPRPQRRSDCRPDAAALVPQPRAATA
jgi:hypothetical protein